MWFQKTCHLKDAFRSRHPQEYSHFSVSSAHNGKLNVFFSIKWELNARVKLGLTFLLSDSPTLFARNMPERISISDFVVLTNEDLSSPGTSSFQSKMSDCRNTVSTVEEVRVVEGGDEETHAHLSVYLSTYNVRSSG